MWGREPCWVAGGAPRWIGAEGPALNDTGHVEDCSLVLTLEFGAMAPPNFTWGKKHKW